MARPRRTSATGESHLTVRVLSADDQSIVRTGLATILDAQPDMAVVGQALMAARPSRRLVNCARMYVCSTSVCRT